MSKIAIGRFIEGVTLNGMEYILKDNNIEVELFDTLEKAIQYMNNQLIPLTDSTNPSLTQEEFKNSGIYFINEEDIK